MSPLRILVVGLVLLAVPAVAHAYPQFQLTDAQTCASCHHSPAGGGILAEMGRMTSEDIASTEETSGEFMYGKVPLPSWLELGGDLRGAGGVISAGGSDLWPVGFPMQFDLYGRAATKGVSLNVTAGLRGSAELDQDPLSFLQSREHYVMYKPEEGGEGYYVRAGKFMPVFGLRLAEHSAYTRRYGQTPLWSESYGVGAGWLSPGLEVHATAFVHDPFRTVEFGDGGALYAEKRLLDGKATAGVEARYAASDDEARATGGVTGKYWFEGKELLLQGELQVTHQTFDAGDAREQIVGYVQASKKLRQGWLLDLGVGHYDEDLAVQDLDRDAIDANLHWFWRAHVELVLMTRLQTIAFGAGGDTSGWALAQVHYRL